MQPISDSSHAATSLTGDNPTPGALITPIVERSIVDNLSPITFHPQDGAEEILVPAAAHTLEGFRDWALSDDFPRRGKITFVPGELIVDMSPESIEEHSEVKSEISRVLLDLVRKRKLGRLYIDGVLITNKAAGVSNEPDALFVSKATQKSGRLIFTPEKGRPQSSKEIVGTVDWVMEIVSPSSRRKGAKLLRDAYFKAGIPEYWLVDALGDEIDVQLLVPGEGGYVAVKSQDNWIASPTFGCSFRLTRDKDDDGFWEYTLHVQEKS